MKRTVLRSIGAWIALAAMCVLVVVPTLARATAVPAVPGMGEVCTAEGMRMAPMEGDSAPGAPQGLDHCPICVLQAAGGSTPPSAAPAALALALAAAPAMPALFLVAPRPLFAWASAAPRGPPAAA